VAAPEPAIPIPDGMLTRPWRHQKAALKFCMEKFAAGLFGLLLAMGMGTGKSLVFCMLMLALDAKRTLIACPLRVVPVWITQFERHVGVPVVIAALDDEAGSVTAKQQLASEKMRLAQTLGVPFIAIVNYDSGWRDPFGEWAERGQWDLFGMDKAHRAKAARGKISLWCRRMRTHAKYRIAMTGTPDLYILDEPTAGLDPSATHEMMNIIKAIHKDGGSILISSHILQDMDEICTNLAILEKGNLIFSHALEGSFVVKTEPIPPRTLDALAQKYSFTGNESRTVLHVKTDKAGVAELVKALAAESIGIYEVSSSNVKTIVQEQLHIKGEEG
jgi:hypothetical protein